MAKFDLIQFAQEAIAQGEELIGVVRVNWNGMTPATALINGGLSGLSGPLGSELGGPPPEDPPAPDPDSLVGFPSAKQMAIALTGGRLLIWGLGFSGKPKEYLGEVPLSALVKVQAGVGGFGEVIRITLKSTAVVDLEILRGEPGEDFSTQLEHLIG